MQYEGYPTSFAGRSSKVVRTAGSEPRPEHPCHRCGAEYDPADKRWKVFGAWLHFCGVMRLQDPQPPGREPTVSATIKRPPS